VVVVVGNLYVACKSVLFVSAGKSDETGSGNQKKKDWNWNWPNLNPFVLDSTDKSLMYRWMAIVCSVLWQFI